MKKLRRCHPVYINVYHTRYKLRAIYLTKRMQQHSRHGHDETFQRRLDRTWFVIRGDTGRRQGSAGDERVIASTFRQLAVIKTNRKDDATTARARASVHPTWCRDQRLSDGQSVRRRRASICQPACRRTNEQFDDDVDDDDDDDDDDDYDEVIMRRQWPLTQRFVVVASSSIDANRPPATDTETPHPLCMPFAVWSQVSGQNSSSKADTTRRARNERTRQLQTCTPRRKTERMIESTKKGVVRMREKLTENCWTTWWAGRCCSCWIARRGSRLWAPLSSDIERRRTSVSPCVDASASKYSSAHSFGQGLFNSIGVLVPWLLPLVGKLALLFYQK